MPGRGAYRVPVTSSTLGNDEQVFADSVTCTLREGRADDELMAHD